MSSSSVSLSMSMGTMALPLFLAVVPRVLEQIGMRPSADEDDCFVGRLPIKPIDQQKITANVALAMRGPVASQSMIEPLRTQRSVNGDEQEHRLFEPAHVVTPRMRQALPVFAKALGV